MKKEEFEFIIKKGEGQFVEFKGTFNSKNLRREIVAFANLSGGKIFLGISDKGINITNKLKSEIESIARNCDPIIKISLKDHENTLIISIKEGSNKPYSCKEGFYIRSGANSQKMTRDEIIEFSIQEGKISFDEQINEEFDYKKDFDDEKFNEYLKITKLTRNLNQEELLINLKVAKIVNSKIKLNNAGVLFFAKEPSKFFLQSKVICINFLTNDRIEILDKKYLIME